MSGKRKGRTSGGRRVHLGGYIFIIYLILREFRWEYNSFLKYQYIATAFLAIYTIYGTIEDRKNLWFDRSTLIAIILVAFLSAYMLCGLFLPSIFW